MKNWRRGWTRGDLLVLIDECERRLLDLDVLQTLEAGEAYCPSRMTIVFRMEASLAFRRARLALYDGTPALLLRWPLLKLQFHVFKLWELATVAADARDFVRDRFPDVTRSPPGNMTP